MMQMRSGPAPLLRRVGRKTHREVTNRRGGSCDPPYAPAWVRQKSLAGFVARASGPVAGAGRPCDNPLPHTPLKLLSLREFRPNRVRETTTGGLLSQKTLVG